MSYLRDGARAAAGAILLAFWFAIVMFPATALVAVVILIGMALPGPWDLIFVAPAAWITLSGVWAWCDFVVKKGLF